MINKLYSSSFLPSPLLLFSLLLIYIDRSCYLGTFVYGFKSQ